MVTATAAASVATPFGTGATRYCGEMVAFDLPSGGSWSHKDLVLALRSAGLDDKAARPLTARNSFIRACRKHARDNGGKLCRELADTVDELSFQLTLERKDTDHLAYDFVAIISLDKATGEVVSTDLALTAAVKAELAPALEARRPADVSRLVISLCDGNADLFNFKRGSGVYFVPACHLAFVDKLDTFLRTIGGSILRIPVPEVAPAPAAPGTPAGSPPPPCVPTTVTIVMNDGISDLISQYEEALKVVRTAQNNGTLKPVDLGAARRAVKEAREKINRHREFLGVHAARLEDHAARVDKLIRDEAARIGIAKLTDAQLAALGLKRS